MKTITSFTLALAATVLAAEHDILPNKRDVQTISTVIMQTSTALQQLDTTVKAFNGQDFTQLATDALNVKNALNAGTQQIQATTPISAQDAITLQSSLSPVQQVGASLITNLNAKKPQFQQAGLCQVVQQQTADIGTAAQGLISATVSKIPQNLQAVAGQLTAQFTQQLNDAAANFAPGNCTNSGTNSGTASGVAFSNSSASSSSANTTPATDGLGRSSGSSHAVSAFGLIVAGAVSLLML
ncbi:unnamed protein product [Discula destructiva]